MKTLLIGPLLIGLLLAPTTALAAEPSSFESETVAVPPTHPAMYSFVDVYRLTVAGPMAAGLPAPDSTLEAPIRVAAGATQLAAEPRFSVSRGRQPDKWLLLLAGLALAGWVAHRRLAHTL
jgi:hypothetical protein